MNRLTFAEQNKLKGADALVTPKSIAGVIEHYVLYLGKSPDGQDVYMDNNNIEGVRFLTEERLLKENFQFNRIRKFNGNEYERNFAVNRAVKMHGARYHLTQFNCEHFANYVQFNQPSSKQVDNGVGIVATAAALAFLFYGIGD